MSENEDIVPAPEQPDPKDTSWIALLVRAILNSPPVPGINDKLTCPSCGCDHQKFLGAGLFHPSEDGTKLVAMFPTTGGMAHIDLPEDIKVSTDTFYVRYVCLCNGHHWAECTAWHDDHSYFWAISLASPPGEGVPQLAPGQVPTAHATSPEAPIAIHGPPPHPGEQSADTPVPSLLSAITGAQSPLSSLQPSQNPLMDLIQGLLKSPTLAGLAGGPMTPILVLPMPTPAVPVIVPMKVGPVPQLPPPPKAAVPQQKMKPITANPGKAPAKTSEVPASAKVHWNSWDKKTVEEELHHPYPTLPNTKGPHFFVAYNDVKTVSSRTEWLMRIALDLDKNVSKLVWAFLLWHDRICLVLNVSKVDDALRKAIFEALTAALVKNNSVRAQGMGLYKRSDYVTLTKPKK